MNHVTIHNIIMIVHDYNMSVCRPRLAILVLEQVAELLPLPGVAYGIAPKLLMIKSLIGVGRFAEAMELCLNIIRDWHKADHLSNVQLGLQLSQALLIGSIASLELQRYDIAYLMVIR